MSKIDFPTGVELPTRGGGKALLYEFFEDRWWGRAKLPGGYNNVWRACSWHPGGTFPNDSSLISSQDIVWTPPKRKAWIVWRQEALYDNALVAAAYAAQCGGIVQEIERP